MSGARQVIKELRELHKLSDRALATAAGLHQPTLSRFLNGTSAAMEIGNLQALCRVFGVTLSELIGEVPLGSSVPAREINRLMTHLSTPEQEQLLRIAKALQGASDTQ